MPYSRSAYRIDFEARVEELLQEARAAQKLGASLRGVRDMTFQCAVFQTCAALETYIRLIVEGWVQKLKANNLGAKVPHPARARYFTKALAGSLEAYMSTGDEAKIFRALESKAALWDIMQGKAELPTYINGVYLHENTAYPSNKNLKRLFYRLGINNIHAEVSRILSRDAEGLIEGFQSVRTNIAHASPDDLTIGDVRRLLRDISDFVRAVDRVFYRHVMAHGGNVCWH
ncbi:hypothetical protein LRS10_08615 [Phenylobacterium sp. J426]|uniref:HEPN domain-containing protein n=1 Tax=Phenylobacterium sp. J426 TaxID=2898439 RepID=UPI0021508B25|nr:HEPN domain-containing protein [Phenylobacterium sp. J426]MCR5874220.1 hypothetical protein [Phenylobacterium sp. J426]